MAQNQKLRDQTKELAQYTNALNAKIDQIVSRLAHFGETLAAVVDYLGEDCIQAKIDELRTKRRQKHEDELEQGVQFLIQNGLATVAPEGAEIGSESFIVGDEVSPDGSKVRIQHELKRLNAAGQAKYLGKKVGDEITVEGYPTKVVIRVIYQVDMAKVGEYTAQKKAAAEAEATSKAIAQAEAAAEASVAIPAKD